MTKVSKTAMKPYITPPPPVPEEMDELYMRHALTLAKRAAEMDEVPVGAVIVRGDSIIAEACNLREHEKSATAHAEILAIETACKSLGGWRLHGCTLYVTLEPCAMCAGAAINARLDRVVFGAYDKRFGALGSLCRLSELPFNHDLSVREGVLEEDCRHILQDYFKKKR